MSERIRSAVVPIDGWTPALSASAFFRYVDISSVDRETKRVVGATELPVADAPSRARQLLRTDDVLVSTVRPNLNAVAMVPPELDGAVGSTGFTVLRALRERLLPRYLFHWVRTPMFVSEMVKSATGANYPAISDRIVLESRMPIPVLEEQRRIAETLDKADNIRRKRKEAIVLTERLLQSAFLEKFGDPVANPKGWGMTTLGDEADEMKYGTSVKCTPSHDGRLPVLRIPNVVGGVIDWSDLKFADLPESEIATLRLRPGDLLFVRSNGNPAYIGRCAMFASDRPALFASYLIRVRLANRRLTPAYVRAALSSRSYRQVLTGQARTTAGNYNISTDGLRRLALPAPPLPLQQAYERVEASSRPAIERLSSASAEADRLFSALVQQAFAENQPERARSC